MLEKRTPCQISPALNLCLDTGKLIPLQVITTHPIDGHIRNKFWIIFPQTKRPTYQTEECCPDSMPQKKCQKR